jgi:toxin ParE1/3/4
MKITWSDEAKQDIHEIYTYHRFTANSIIAKSIKTKIFLKTRLLIKHKELGRMEENKNISNRNYRFLVSGDYRLISWKQLIPFSNQNKNIFTRANDIYGIS